MFHQFQYKFLVVESFGYGMKKNCYFQFHKMFILLLSFKSIMIHQVKHVIYIINYSVLVVIVEKRLLLASDCYELNCRVLAMNFFSIHLFSFYRFLLEHSIEILTMQITFTYLYSIVSFVYF